MDLEHNKLLIKIEIRLQFRMKNENSLKKMYFIELKIQFLDKHIGWFGRTQLGSKQKIGESWGLSIKGEVKHKIMYT